LFLAKLPSGRSLIKVLDFGIAKEAEDAGGKNLTSTFSALGSAAYMSPEQVRMAKSVDARSDVWAFGVVLYELLTAEIPFDGGSVPALSAAIIADPPRPIGSLRPEIPPALAEAIHACLEKDRDQRTPSLAVLAHALAPFGGPYAQVSVSRVVQALGDAPSAPSSTLATTSAAAVTRVEQASGPSWSKTQAGAAGGRSRAARVAVLIGASVAALLVVVAVVAGLSTRTSSRDGAAAVESALQPPALQRAEASVAASRPGTAAAPPLEPAAPGTAETEVAVAPALPAASSPEARSRTERGSTRGSTKSGSSSKTTGKKKPMVKDL
jgi:eukaryotic-like serine/threonine-protein kinase